MTRAEQCLRDHVDRIVDEEPDLQGAASFLVNYVCAKEVFASARFERNTVLVTQYNAMMKAVGTTPAASQPQPAGIARPPLSAFPEWGNFALSVDPDTGEVIYPQRSGTNPGIWALTTAQMVGQTARLSTDPDPVPADLRALASDLVLTARERLAKRH